MSSVGLITREVYHYRGHTRTKLEWQLDETERRLQAEKRQRIELGRALKEEDRTHDEIIYDLKATKALLKQEYEEHRHLKLQWEETKRALEDAIVDAKEAKREKKNLQEKLYVLQKECVAFEETARTKVEESQRAEGEMEVLSRERAHEEQKEQNFTRRRLEDTRENIKSVHKKADDRQRSFDIERKRWEAKQISDTNSMKRIQVEKEQAQLEALATEQKVAQKREQLQEALSEIDKLEDELKECEDQIRVLHARVIQLENEKVSIRKFYTDQQITSQASAKREIEDYNNRVQELDAQQAKLAKQLQQFEADREVFRNSVREECKIRINDIKIDIETEKESAVTLERRLQSLRVLDTQAGFDQKLEIANLTDATNQLQDIVDGLKKKHQAELTKMNDHIENTIFAIDKVRCENEVLKAEKVGIIAEIKSKYSQDMSTKDQAKLSKLERANKRAAQDVKQWATLKPTFIANEATQESALLNQQQQWAEQIAELQKQKNAFRSRLEELEEKHRTNALLIIENRQEIKRLSSYPDEAKEFKIKSAKLAKTVNEFEKVALKEKEELEHQLKSLNYQLEQTQSKFQGSQNEIKSLTENLARLSQRERALDQETSDLANQLEALAGQVEGSEANVTKFKTELAARESHLQETLQDLKQQMKDDAAAIIQKSLEDTRQLKEQHAKNVRDAETQHSVLLLEQTRALQVCQEEIRRWKYFSHQLQAQVEAQKVAVQKAAREVIELRHETGSTGISTFGETEKYQLLIERTKQELEAEKNKIEKAQIDIQELQQGKEQASLQLKQSHDSVGHLIQQKEEHFAKQQAFRIEIETLKAQQNANVLRLEALQQEKFKTETLVKELSQKNQDLEAEKENLSSQLTALATGDQTTVFADNLAQLKVQAKKQENELLGHFNVAETKRAKTEREKDALNQQLEKEKSSVTVLTATKQDLQKNAARLEADLETAKTHNAALAEANTNLQTELNKIKASSEELLTSSLQNIKTTMQSQIDLRQQKYFVSEKEVAGLDVAMKEKREAISKLNEAKALEIAQLDQEIKDNNVKVEELKASGLSKDEKLKELTTQLTNLKLTLSSESAGVEGMESSVNKINAQLSSLTLEIQKNQADIEEAQKAQQLKNEELDALKQNNISLTLKLEELKKSAPSKTLPTTPDNKPKVTKAKAFNRRTSDAIEESLRQQEAAKIALQEEFTKRVQELASINNKIRLERKNNSELETKRAELATRLSGLKDESQSLAKEVAVINKQIREMKHKRRKSTLENKEKAPAPPREGNEKSAIIIQSLIRGKLQRNHFKSTKYRFQVASELLQTETNYVDYLQTIVDYYMIPLKKLDWIHPTELDTIFGNLNQVLSSNRTFLSHLQPTMESFHVDTTIGDIFIQHGTLLAPHTDYVKCFSQAKDALMEAKKKSDNLKNFLDIVRFMPSSQNKGLDDLLIMPVQRVPRYKLLLTDLMKRTPETHPDYPLLNQAIVQISELATSINETNRQFAMLEDWKRERESISGDLPENQNRVLLEKLPATTVSLKKFQGKEDTMMVLLTNDYIIFAKAHKKRLSLTKSTAFSHKIVEAIPLGASSPISINEKPSGSFKHALDVAGNLIEIGEEKLQSWLHHSSKH